MLVAPTASQRRYVIETIKYPACDWEIKDAGIKVQVEGRELLACCDTCADKVKEDLQVYT